MSDHISLSSRKTVSKSFGLFRENLWQITKLNIGYVIVYTVMGALAVGSALMLADGSVSALMLGADGSVNGYGAIGFFVALSFVILYIFCPFYISLSRLGAGMPKASNLLGITTGGNLNIYFIALIKLFVIMLLPLVLVAGISYSMMPENVLEKIGLILKPVGAAGNIVMGEGHQIPSAMDQSAGARINPLEMIGFLGSSLWLMLIGSIVSIYLMIRYSPIITLAAIEGSADASRAWKLTQGRVWYMIKTNLWALLIYASFGIVIKLLLPLKETSILIGMVGAFIAAYFSVLTFFINSQVFVALKDAEPAKP